MIFVRRRAEAPAPRDVREALEEDFYGKCYLCESHCRIAQIEHLKPQVPFQNCGMLGATSFWRVVGRATPRNLRAHPRLEGPTR